MGLFVSCPVVDDVVGNMQREGKPEWQKDTKQLIECYNFIKTFIKKERSTPRPVFNM